MFARATILNWIIGGTDAHSIPCRTDRSPAFNLAWHRGAVKSACRFGVKDVDQSHGNIQR